MPAKYRASKGAKPRGVANRSLGLEWVIENSDEGVVYFADDDNTYDIRLFEEVGRLVFMKVLYFVCIPVKEDQSSVPLPRRSGHQDRHLLSNCQKWQDCWIF